MKHVNKLGVLLISVLMFVLVFCGAAAAHPGHGTLYPPEEVTSGQTSDQSTDSGTTGNSGKTNTISKKNTGSTSGASSRNTGTKSVQSETASGNAGNSGDQSAEDTSKPSKVANTTSDSNISDTNATSEDSNSSPLNTTAIVMFLVVGLGAIGFFLKGNVFN